MEAYNKMEYESINRLIFKMCLPPMLSMFLQYSYNMIDSMFVACINEQALAAVSLSFPITNLMNSLSVWIGVGINVLIAGYLGQKRQDKANSVVSMGLILSISVGIIVNIIVLLTMKPYYSAFTENNRIFEYGCMYMQICAFMQVPNMVHIAVQKMLQGTGNMISPMWFQIAGVVFNLVFDPLLIFGIGPFPEMGIKGAALATVLGYVLSMLISLYVLIFTKQKVKLKIKGFVFDFQTLKNIFGYGLPSFAMNVLSSLMITFVNMFLVTYSDTVVAFFGAYFKVQQLIFMSVNGLIQGCLPIMRYNYGAKNTDRVNQTYRSGTVIAVIIMVISTILLLLFPRQILLLFSASETMCSIGVPAIRIMALSYCFGVVSTMIATYVQAIGKIVPSMIIQILRQGILLFPLMWLLNSNFNLMGIWWSFPLTEVIVFIIAVIIVKMQNHRKKYSIILENKYDKK